MILKGLISWLGKRDGKRRGIWWKWIIRQPVCLVGLRKIRIIKSVRNTKGGKRYKLTNNNPDKPAQTKDQTSKSSQITLA